MNPYQEIWTNVLADLKNYYDEATFNDVFKGLEKIYKFQNGYIYVIVPHDFTKTRINRIYINTINEILKEYVKEKCMMKFVTKNEVENELSAIAKPDKQIHNMYDDKNLNKTYTFDNFVIGKSNNFAFRMAMKVADQPGVLANPLYIFGNVGLGKTHLMQAIGNYIVDQDINCRLLYIKADTFVEDYTNMIVKKGLIDEFYNKYRNLDVLLIDDIQILSIAKKTQMEFFKLFDFLFQQNKQIVITSDRPANELSEIMERLTSRFQMGGIVDIQTPDLNHRIDILKKKLSLEVAEKEIFPNNVLEYIAESFDSSVRELEGALKRVLFYCVSNEIDINLDNAKEALDVLLQNKKNITKINTKNYDNLQSVICSFYNISIDELISKNRSSKFTIPRHVAMYLLKKEYNLTYKQIGSIMGGRDHTTVIAAVEKIDNDLKINSDLQLTIETIKKKLHIN